MTEPASEPAAGLSFLLHAEGDDVAVAVRDSAPGDHTCACLSTGTRSLITVTAPIPLGHKVALRDLGSGEAVTEYGATIGLTRCPVTAGELVHTHNLRSARWHTST